MAFLLLAALLWVGVHVGISGTALRGRIVARLGETGFTIAFSLVSFAAIAMLVRAWQGAETAPIWFAPAWLRWVIAGLMLPVFVVFTCSLAGNPTAQGGGGLLARGPRGIQRVTRHPMLCAFAAWAGLHILGNGDTAAIVFFGAFLVTALAGMPSIDAKMARRHPDAWRALPLRPPSCPSARSWPGGTGSTSRRSAGSRRSSACCFGPGCCMATACCSACRC